MIEIMLREAKRIHNPGGRSYIPFKFLRTKKGEVVCIDKNWEELRDFERFVTGRCILGCGVTLCTLCKCCAGIADPYETYEHRQEIGFEHYFVLSHLRFQTIVAAFHEIMDLIARGKIIGRKPRYREQRPEVDMSIGFSFTWDIEEDSDPSPDPPTMKIVNQSEICQECLKPPEEMPKCTHWSLFPLPVMRNPLPPAPEPDNPVTPAPEPDNSFPSLLEPDNPVTLVPVNWSNNVRRMEREMHRRMERERMEMTLRRPEPRPEYYETFHTPRSAPTQPLAHLLWILSNNTHLPEGLNQAEIERHTAKEETQKDLGECSICLSKMKEGQVVRRLKCIHVYHTKCIDQWLREEKPTCPLCMKNITD